MVVFVDGCQCDGLHAAAYIASGIHQVTAYGAVEGSTDGAVAQIGACCVQAASALLTAACEVATLDCACSTCIRLTASLFTASCIRV